MSVNSQIGTINASMRDLVALHGQMNEGEHLEGGIVTLHSRSDSQAVVDGKVGFASAARFAIANAQVRRVIGNEVGGAKADEIMKAVFSGGQIESNQARHESLRSTAMSREQLGLAIRLTHEAAQSNTIDMSPADRGRLIDQLENSPPDDPAAFMKDKQANKLVHLAAGANGRGQDARFLDAVHAFERRIDNGDRFAALKLAGFDFGHDGVGDSGNDGGKDGRGAVRTTWMNGVASEAARLRSEFLGVSESGELTIPPDTRAKLADADFGVLNPQEIRQLFTETKAAVAESVRKDLVKDLTTNLKKKETQLGEIISYGDSLRTRLASSEFARRGSDGSADTVSMASLKSIKATLRLSDGHLRKTGKFLYAKSDHAKGLLSRFINHAKSLGTGKRSDKFKTAKLTVRILVARSLAEAGMNQRDAVRKANQIMHPWMTSNNALDHDDMGCIIDEVKQVRTAHRGIKSDMEKIHNTRWKKARENSTDGKPVEPKPIEFDECFSGDQRVQGASVRGAFSKYLALFDAKVEMNVHNALVKLDSRLDGVDKKLLDDRDAEVDWREEIDEVSPGWYDEAKSEASGIRDLLGHERFDLEFENDNDFDLDDFYGLLDRFIDDPMHVSRDELRSFPDLIHKRLEQHDECLHKQYFEPFMEAFGPIEANARKV